MFLTTIESYEQDIASYLPGCESKMHNRDIPYNQLKKHIRWSILMFQKTSLCSNQGQTMLEEDETKAI